MKWRASFLLAGGLCFGGQTVKTLTGVIHDNRCVGPNCATQCPITKDPRYTLQSGDDAWLVRGALSDQKTLDRYVGRKVVVTATVEGNNKLKLKSIAPAR